MSKTLQELKIAGKNRKAEAGFGVVNVLFFVAVAGMVTGVMSSNFRDAVKAKVMGAESKLGMERNDAAMNFVQQLLNTGAIYFEPTLGMVHTNIKGDKRWAYRTFTDPVSKQEKAAVDVILCEKQSNKSTEAAVTAAACPAGTYSIKVPVVFNAYKVSGSERFANASAEVLGKKSKQRSNNMLSLGNLDQKHIERNVANTDYCFFMKPAGGAGGIQYSGKGTARKDLYSAQPRAEGTGPGDFADNYDITPVPEEQRTTYEVLKGLRPQLLAYYKQGYRTAEVESKDYQDKGREVFAGVMPNQGAVGGPQFQYFLAAHEGTAHHLQDATTFDPARLAQMKQGCATTTGDSNADFCTRVDIPYKSYVSNFKTRCVQRNKKMSPGEVFSVQKSVQASCDPGWVDKIQGFVNSTEGNLLVQGGTEYLIGDYIKLMEGRHPSQVALVGSTEYFGVPKNWVPHIPRVTPTRNAKDDKGEMGEKADVEALPLIPGQGQIPANEVAYYELEDVKQVSLNNYTAQKCVYYKYYNAQDPRTCRIELLTKDAQGWWVCRTSDGCFDENTFIRLADGSDRKIIDLTPQDLVLNPKTGLAMKIRNMSIGPEKNEMIEVETADGKLVKVTLTHPFKTQSGWKKAENLAVGDEIEGLNGSETQKIKKAKRYMPTTVPNVVNLFLDAPEGSLDDHYVLANGVPTGDLHVQQLLEKGALPK